MNFNGPFMLEKMMSLNTNKVLWVIVLIFIVTIAVLAGCVKEKNTSSLVLLLPDGDEALVFDPRVTAWLDTAQEEGFALSVMTDSDFVELGDKIQDIPGVILPDHTHQEITTSLLSTIEQYVSAGGNLMLTYDAGTLTEDGFYSLPISRLSQLAGVDYALYEDLQEKMISTSVVVGSEKVMWQLQVPPGKSMPFEDPENATLKKLNLSPNNSVKNRGEKASANELPVKKAVEPTDDLYVITGYLYGQLLYPSFVTQGEYSGKTLLASPTNGLIAGVNAFGKGNVLFVNLPLSRLKGETDGVLTHGFIKYFGADLVKLPRMATHPRGTGGIVLNWHVDAAAALDPLSKLEAMNVWDHGPYSIHLTAGPDTNFFGDKIGLDVPNNKTTQNWINYFVEKGHEVGSHGGWIHNYFAANASEDNQDEIQELLELNKSALEQVTGLRVTEYSAPSGNNPKWAVDWLEKNGFVAYYFVGHAGLSVTRNYREGQLHNPGLWAFPVTTYGKYATIEEFSVNNISASEISLWFSKLVEFNRRYQTSRLIYFHPPAVKFYPTVIGDLVDLTNQYISEKRFAWYTMKDLANFQSRRLKVNWTVSELSNGDVQFAAEHPKDMTDITWMLPATIYSKPEIVKGDAKVLADNDNWLVIVNSGKNITFTTQELN